MKPDGWWRIKGRLNPVDWEVDGWEADSWLKAGSCWKAELLVHSRQLVVEGRRLEGRLLEVEGRWLDDRQLVEGRRMVC